MKNLAVITFALTVLMSLIATAQETPRPNPAPAAARASSKAITLSGTVSDEGQTLIDGKDTRWAVANPEALNGRDGGQVTIKCLAYSDRHEIRVLSIKTGQPEVRYTANQSDSAFRR